VVATNECRLREPEVTLQLALSFSLSHKEEELKKEAQEFEKNKKKLVKNAPCILLIYKHGKKNSPQLYGV